MWNRPAWATACLLLLAAPAWAQQSPPAADAAASAAMERARRQAAGPMRVILEASKSKRRVQEPDTSDPAEAPRRGPVRAAASAPAPADAAVIVSRALLPVATTALTDEGPAVASKALGINAGGSGGNASGASNADANGITTEITLRSDDLQRRVANVAAPAMAPAAVLSPVLAAPGGAAASLPVPLDYKPKLLTMVDPVLTPNLLEGVRRDAGVTADLTLRPDGSVADVSVLPPASRQLVRAVVTALEQWRFAPLPSERVHRVQLVFRDSP